MENELFHHGTKGMKWGIRRWQNKDGSLTPAGRKRYGEDSDNDSPETKPDNPAYSSARKSVKDMSDAELNTAINRLRNEQTYQQLYSQMNPPQVNKAKEFISNAWDKAIQPAVLEAGKDALKKFLTKAAADAMGLNGDEALSAMEKLEKQAKIARLESEIATNKQKKQQVDDWYKKREDKGKSKNNDSDKEQPTDDQRKKQQEEAKKAMAENEKAWKAKADELNKKTYDSDNSKEAERAAKQKAREDDIDAASRKHTEKILKDIDKRVQDAADKQAKAEEKAQAKSDKYKEAYEKAKESSKVYEGTVEGEGQSKFTGWKSEKNSKTYDVDFDWSNSEVKPTTSLATVSTSVARTSGQQFLNSFLLEDKSN